MDNVTAVFLDKASIHPDDLDLSGLEKCADDWRWLDNARSMDVDEAIKGRRIVISNKVPLTAGTLEQAAGPGLICAAATGVNHIDIEAAGRLGITVCNVRAYATPSVVQHVFAVLLNLVTRLDRYRQDVISGEWSNSGMFCLLDYPIRELHGKVIGIVGYGELGREVAKVAKAFGMQVLVAKRNSEDQREGRIALHDLLARADVLTLHCPLTDATRGLIGKRELAMMKADAILINTARGGLVDEMALLQALKNGRPGGAALDVLEQEPPAADNAILQNLPDNLIITPHIAWASREARQRLVDQLATVVIAYLQGAPVNVIC
jgi:glycerate dehydrogenase